VCARLPISRAAFQFDHGEQVRGAHPGRHAARIAIPDSSRVKINASAAACGNVAPPRT
jgi:hypothetical protein